MMPRGAGGLVGRGRSVKTLQMRTRGPLSHVMSLPWRPTWPRPAWMVMGTLMAVSFPQGTAW